MRSQNRKYISRIGNTADPIKRPEKASSALPSEDHVMTRDINGEPLSLYKSSSWDFTAYRPATSIGSLIINFEKFPSRSVNDIKRVLFIIIYYSSGSRLKPTTLFTYLKALRSIANFAADKNVSLISVLSEKEILKKYLRTKPVKTTLAALRVVLHHLLTIGPRVSGIYGVNQELVLLVKLAIKQSGKDKQHPVIPNRIFAKLITDLSTFFEELQIYEERIYALISEMEKNKGYGREHATQREHGIRKLYFPTFMEAIALHDLEEFSQKFGIKKSISVGNFIKKIQHAAQTTISIFTGMRRGEVVNLKINCLYGVNQKNEPITVKAVTSKLHDQDLVTEWISSSAIIAPIRIAENLSRIILASITLPMEERPLFPSTKYLGFSCAVPSNNKRTVINASSVKSAECFTLFNSNPYIISKEDLVFLDNIDPLRDWSNENAFKLGAIWRFTNHQYRRSLAYYVAQSGLVSLPELKQQLKHITKAMTLYYSKFHASKRSKVSYYNEFYDYVLDVKPEADAVAYLTNVIKSEDQLYAAKGKRVDHAHKLFLTDDREDLVKRFKKGEIAYSDTPVGVCTTNEPCTKRAMIEVSACINCPSAIIKPSNLERVIQRQKLLLKECARNSTDDFEYRVEAAELRNLTEYQSKILESEKT